MAKLLAFLACIVGISVLSALTCWIVWRRGKGSESFRQFFRAATRFRLNAVASSTNATSDPWLDGRKDVVLCQNLHMAYQIAGIIAFVILLRVV